MFSAESLFIATVLGGVNVCVYVRLCVQYICTCRGFERKTHLSVCLVFCKCAVYVCPPCVHL